MQEIVVKEVLNPSAWVDEYGDYLLNYAWFHVRNQETAEDLVQETFVAALQSKESFAGKSSERTWLTSILRHKLADHYRRKCRYKQAADSVAQEWNHDGIVKNGRWSGFWASDGLPDSWRVDPASIAQRNAFFAMLDSCLAEMPKPFASAILLREIEQLTTKEICTILDISERNLWVILHRARRFLRRCIELRWLKSRR